MTAAVYNITINQGADFSRAFVIKEDGVTKDLTNHSFQAQTREHPTHADAVSFTCTVSDAANGIMGISLTDEQTAAMSAGTWYWDLIMTDDAGLKSRLMEGKTFVKPGVTR